MSPSGVRGYFENNEHLQSFSSIDIATYVKKIRRLKISGGFASNIEHIGSTCNLKRANQFLFSSVNRNKLYADWTSAQYRSVLVGIPLRMPLRSIMPDPIQFVDGMKTDIRSLYISGDYSASKQSKPFVAVSLFNMRNSSQRILLKLVFGNKTVAFERPAGMFSNKDLKSDGKFTYQIDVMISTEYEGSQMLTIWEHTSDERSKVYETLQNLQMNFVNTFDFAKIESNVEVYNVYWLSTRYSWKKTCGFRAFEPDQLNNKVPRSKCRKQDYMICEGSPSETPPIVADILSDKGNGTTNEMNSTAAAATSAAGSFDSDTGDRDVFADVDAGGNGGPFEQSVLDLIAQQSLGMKDAQTFCRYVGAHTLFLESYDTLERFQELARTACRSSKLVEQCPMVCNEREVTTFEDFMITDYERPPSYLKRLNLDGYIDFEEDFDIDDAIVFNVYPKP
ncbi:unnamed protein product [Caenorhabditis bovis]|uniref:Uncharacterized protein n=1 Tax=Caenorhabditis bovis TaxID=2654633 RepID=A0A8S1F7H1_9PELO|nr:unnamed protein product [Caenorhabditis bovis]